MKTDNWLRISGMLVILAGLLTFPSCHDDDKESVPLNQRQLTKIAKDWKIESVFLDGVDNTSYYEGFLLSINGTSPSSIVYTTAGRPHYSPWPSDGKLLFGSDVMNTLIRDYGDEALQMTYTVNTTTLEISFTFSDEPFNARQSSVQGEWHFVFGL